MTRRIDSLGDEFGQLFTGFRHTAFRLETLQRYSVPYEREPLRRFSAGEPRPPDPAKDEWTSFLRDAAGRGKTVQRVHVVAEPLSDYVQYELAWSYDESVAAGEDVRIVPFSHGKWPEDLPRHDYWLFDSRDLWVIAYDTDGGFLHIDLVDEPGEVVKHNYWRDAALHQAVTYDEYIRRHPALLEAS